ncbi:MAG: hypothetical protein VX444_06930 [Pseudomonadota bacterium]|nr:hypothetical protein [Pseudomonadota bacterium]
MQKYVLSSLLVAGMSPLAVSAQSAPQGFEYSGYVEFSSLYSDGDSETLGRTEIDLAYNNLFGNFGFSLGIDAFSFDGETESEIYPAFTYSAGDHLFSFGMTRSVLDGSYLPMGQVLGSSFIDLEAVGATGSYLGTVLLFSGDDVRNLGARWDGEFGATRVGLSYNQLEPDSGDTVDAFGFAIRHEIDAISSFADMAFFGGFEKLDVPGDSANSWVIGLEGAANQFVYGLSFGESDFLFDSWARTWVDYKITERATLSAELISVDAGSNEMLYSVGASYNIWEGLVAEVNFIDGDDFDDSLTEFSLRYELYSN